MSLRDGPQNDQTTGRPGFTGRHAQARPHDRASKLTRRPAQGTTWDDQGDRASGPTGQRDDRASRLTSASWDDGTTGRPSHRPTSSRLHRHDSPTRAGRTVRGTTAQPGRPGQPRQQAHRATSSRHHGTTAQRHDGTTRTTSWRYDGITRTTVPAGPQDDQLEATTALLTAASVVNAPRWRRSGRRELNSRVQLGKRRGTRSPWPTAAASAGRKRPS